MKIFNWMHRKLQQGNVYARVPSKQTSDDSCEGKETEADDALLLHNVLDGILTIGTLGLDGVHDSPLCLLPSLLEELENVAEDKHCEEQEQEREQVAEETAKVVLVPLTNSKSLRSTSAREKENNNAEAAATVGPHQDLHSQKELMMEPLLKDDKERKERARTTLADLFAASDDHTAKKTSLASNETKKNKKKNYAKEVNNGSKSNHSKKPDHEKKKKKGEQPTPATTSAATKRVQKMITKMLTKKIHPEMEANGTMKKKSVTAVDMEEISLISQSNCSDQSWRNQP